MKMSDLRVKVDARHFELYNDLAQAIANEAHSLFFVSACLGFHQHCPKEPIRRIEKFWSRTFTNDEWACMYTMALSHWNGDFDHISDDKAVISLMEEYATGGLTYLVENYLRDFMLKGTSDPRLDQTAVRDLPQLLLFELWQLSGEVAPAGATTIQKGL